MTTRTRRKAIEADPQALPRLVSAREVKKVRAAILREYGFEVTDRYAADLVAFVDAMTSPLPEAVNG